MTGVLFPLGPVLPLCVRLKSAVDRCQSSVGQSFVGVAFWEVGIATWLVYGILMKDRVIVIANFVSVVVGLIYLWAIRYYAL